MTKRTAFLSAAILSLVLSFTSAAFAAPEAQPEMRAALAHLQEAKKALESASHDKGGHRAKAVALVNQAIRQVEAGIAFDDTHTSGAEKKMERKH
jgi:hypothetical protein